MISRRLNQAIDMEMDRLSRITDLVYVHVDLDILDPEDIPGAGLPVENGPTADELGRGTLESCSSTPTSRASAWRPIRGEETLRGRGLKSVYRLVEGVIAGVKNR